MPTGKSRSCPRAAPRAPWFDAPGADVASVSGQQLLRTSGLSWRCRTCASTSSHCDLSRPGIRRKVIRSMTTGAIVSPTASTPPAIPPCSPGPTPNSGADQQIRRQVQQVLQLIRHRSQGMDRRSDRREPFPYPIYITPVAEDGTAQTNETIVVLGKHLSERGLDFYYQAPLPYRRVIASWECSNGHWLAMVLDLRWCRSNRHGWYENGGRFLQVVESPMTQRGGSSPRRTEKRASAAG